MRKVKTPHEHSQHHDAEQVDQRQRLVAQPLLEERVKAGSPGDEAERHTIAARHPGIKARGSKASQQRRVGFSAHGVDVNMAAFTNQPVEQRTAAQ